MAEVYHHANAVHLFNHLLSERTHTSVFVVALGGIAYVIVAVVAQGHIHDTTLTETRHVGEVLADGITVLDAQHDAFLAKLLITVKVVGSISD